MRTADLKGAALDWAVAKCEGYVDKGACRIFGASVVVPDVNGRGQGYYPSADWAQGGPIIEREGINLRAIRSEGHALDGMWLAMPAKFAGTGQIVQWVRNLFGDPSQPRSWHGATALAAAMRCYVASSMGDEIDIPEELR